MEKKSSILDSAPDLKLGLLSSDKVLNTEMLNEIFCGNTANVEYFIGLFNLMKGEVDDNVYDLKQLNCDPRDELKKGLIRCSKLPEIGQILLDDVIENDGDDDKLRSDANQDGRGLALKQTALEDQTTEIWAEIGIGGDIMEHENLNDKMDIKSYPCGAYGCNQVLTSLANFESHYHRCHNYVCATCKRSFVSNFLLDVHLQENHDSYFDVLCSKIDMYRCLVETCQDKFRTPDLRKDHMVSRHKFPSSFSFHQPISQDKKTIKGLKTKTKQTSHNNRSQNWQTASSTKIEDMETNGKHDDSEDRFSMSLETNTNTNSNDGMFDDKLGNYERMDEGRPSQNTRVPMQICFGRGSQRAFNNRRGGKRGKGRNWYQSKEMRDKDTTVDIENVDMNDLEQALNS